MLTYIYKIVTDNTGQRPTGKFQFALAWRYAKPEILKGDYPRILKEVPSSEYVAIGNSSPYPIINQVMQGLKKVTKLVRASPIPLRCRRR